MNWYHFRNSAHFNPVCKTSIRNRTSDWLKWRTACDGHSTPTPHGCFRAIVPSPAEKIRSFWTKCPAARACSYSPFHYRRTWKCLITMKRKKKKPKTNKRGVASLKTLIMHYMWIKLFSVTLALSGKTVWFLSDITACAWEDWSDVGAAQVELLQRYLNSWSDQPDGPRAARVCFVSEQRVKVNEFRAWCWKTRVNGKLEG